MNDPFKRIALSFSGGGFRAAAFSLGSLKLLHEAGLLENVHVLSTVSGGTITGAYYAINKKKGKQFETIYKELYAILQNDQIVDDALNILENKEVRVPSKRQNVILSFAESYNRNLFNGINDQGEDRFELLWNEDGFPSHLEDVIFNATDFESGIGFRFWKSENTHRIGNGFNNISKLSAQKIRMADIMAASSCFPGGFEPICIPEDFNWPKDEDYQSAKESLKNVRVPLMDGGIYDNQGIESLLLANKTFDEEPEKQSSCFIIVDVASAGRGFFDMPINEDSTTDQTLKSKFQHLKTTAKWVFKLKNIVSSFLLICAIGMTALFILSIGSESTNAQIIGNGVSAVLLLFLSGILFYLGSKATKLKNQLNNKIGEEIENINKKLPGIVKEVGEAFGNLSLERILSLIKIRATSVLAMTGGIFLKRIRSQGFSSIYDNENLDGKRVDSIIDCLIDENNEEIEIPENVKGIAVSAKEMPTTLWFKNDIDKLSDLIASGRFTLCYNLLKHIKNLENDDNKLIKEKLNFIWEKIAEDPYYDIQTE